MKHKNKELKRLFKEAKRIKPKIHLTAEQIDELNEREILEEITKL